MKEQLHIAGPCALQSLEQGMVSALSARENGVDTVRLSLYKPRTKPGGFEGLKEQGIPLIREIAQATHITPATEVLTQRQAYNVANELVGRHGLNLILWLGARNYNHEVQSAVGSIANGEPKIQVGVKNPMHPDEEAWIGGINWVIYGGASADQVFGIHRGFHPGYNSNPNQYRNPPDFAIAMRVKEETGLRVVIDPSHIGGSVENVFSIMNEVEEAHIREVVFDGTMIEVHPEGIDAKTDAKQQLTWNQYQILRNTSKEVFQHELVA